MESRSFAPGIRVVVRDAEWLIRKVDRTPTGGYALSVIGISELVKDKESIFLTEIEKKVEVLDPADTVFIQDKSSSYTASLLYMESLLRQTPPTDESISIGHRAAMDMVPYQLDPAQLALKQPRQRILIADAVGLGKTMEAGVLLSDLMRRGKGKRILVLTVKSMLTQFQKEMWVRFSIPLTRVDSLGIKRIRSQIPTNHNPFFYYDKAIISIDTLKNNSEYRVYLENAYWDIIVIDEAHNVAERGSTSSQRARLAKLLSSRSDTLIMLSATPHDGKARSFASLMNMLDPTAIANPDDYGPDDIKGLFIRRFKKDIQNQVKKAFQERTISVARATASDLEEAAYDLLVNMQFTRLDRGRPAGELFKTTLEKSLFSSPAACIETIDNRINRLNKEGSEEDLKDISQLEELSQALRQIKPQEFSKYQRLLGLLKDPGYGWTGKDTKDRLVIFTERIETLRFLYDNLLRDLGLNKKQVEVLHGTGMSDVDQQNIVEAFGNEGSPIRLLIASDVASEGINLHYLSHRMIHFDIPWSLMLFQQRNGRIDRYGQEQHPQITYLITESMNGKIRGDMRILELLVQKDEEAARNIGDPSALMGVYDIDAEEKITATSIEKGVDVGEFEVSLNEHAAFDPLAMLMGTAQEGLPEVVIRDLPTLFKDDYAYARDALSFIRQYYPLQVQCYPEEKRIDLTAPEDLKYRFKYFPSEIWPENGLFILSADKDTIQEEIKKSRKEEGLWPNMQYLWPLNPVVEWVNDKISAVFGRHQAPVLTLKGKLAASEVIFIMSGLIPNRKGHPLLHPWFGVTFEEGVCLGIETFDEVCARTGLGKNTFPNTGQEIDTESLRSLLPEAIKEARSWISAQRNEFEKHINVKLNDRYNDLDRLRARQIQQLELDFGDVGSAGSFASKRKQQRSREINRIFDEYIDWIEDTMLTEDNPYIRVVAVLKG